MIYLNTNTAKLQMSIGADTTTAPISVVVSFIDSIDGIGAIEKTIRTTDLIDVCTVPKYGAKREIESVHVIITDTVTTTITVHYTDANLSYKIGIYELDPGDHLMYEDSRGWYALNKYGELKGVGTTGPPGLGTDLAVANITATTLDVTSSTGADATLPSATVVLAGLMSASDKDRLLNDLVESVTGLDTDNTDPQNPIIQIAVDGVTITGDGTPGNPLVGAASVAGNALSKVDDTNVTLTLGGTPLTALLQAVSITVGWTGTLADGRIASAAAWNAKQTAYAILSTLGVLANAVGVLLNDGVGGLSWTALPASITAATTAEIDAQTDNTKMATPSNLKGSRYDVATKLYLYYNY